MICFGPSLVLVIMRSHNIGFMEKEEKLSENHHKFAPKLRLCIALPFNFKLYQCEFGMQVQILGLQKRSNRDNLWISFNISP